MQVFHRIFVWEEPRTNDRVFSSGKEVFAILVSASWILKLQGLGLLLQSVRWCPRDVMLLDLCKVSCGHASSLVGQCLASRASQKAS